MLHHINLIQCKLELAKLKTPVEEPDEQAVNDANTLHLYNKIIQLNETKALKPIVSDLHPLAIQVNTNTFFLEALLTQPVRTCVCLKLIIIM